ncbi:MAG: 4Fe-4S binding protein [Clostridia bacterium]|nr:4Fe-4S binding protein [Clostridia bacterium]
MPNCLTLKKSNCKNCHKCVRNCPVKSIRFSAGQAHIIPEECILCGRCFVVCPQNAKQIVSEIEKVQVMLRSGEAVYASVAPSFAANWRGVGIEGMREALKKLGFQDAEETAIGATMVKREYERMLAEESRDVVISSCCHTVNLLIRKYFPDELRYLADVVSPMQAHCLDIKRRHPEAKTVFIGPCVAKKDEAEAYKGIVDAVLTFEELSGWLAQERIELKKLPDNDLNSRARFFPTTGGILKTMALDASDYTCLALDGIENCVAALRDIQAGSVHKCFIEMSACAGSCVGGPVMDRHRGNPVSDYLAVAACAGPEDFPVDQPEVSYMKQLYTPIDLEAPRPDETQIAEILRQMGKTKPADELNCGTCGYNTCRDKAAAIFQGKAEISMCQPYLMQQPQSCSADEEKHIPTPLLVLNDQMEVQQVNVSAMQMLHLHTPSDILGDNVATVLDPVNCEKVIKTGLGVFSQPMYLAEYERYVKQTVVPIDQGRLLLCIMRDVTEEENIRRRREEIQAETAEVADHVVAKQMRIVQEIASLLGETAAETKAALAKLKESIRDE